MNIETRANSLQSYQVVLYERALHPELFPLKDRRSISHDTYEFETWIMPGAHLLRFEFEGLCACELVTDRDDGLPTSGVVTAFLCAGEHDFEHTFDAQRVTYMTSVQTETLSENLYLATLDETRALAGDTGALCHEWEEPAGPCMSLIDVQRYTDSIHAQGYHLLSQGGLVLRTQALFQHNRD
jgi:hypothetical protein